MCISACKKIYTLVIRVQSTSMTTTNVQLAYKMVNSHKSVIEL